MNAVVVITKLVTMIVVQGFCVLDGVKRFGACWALVGEYICG